MKIIDNQQHNRRLIKSKLLIRRKYRKTINETRTIRRQMLKIKICIDSIIKIKINKNILRHHNEYFNRMSTLTIVNNVFINQSLMFILTTRLRNKKITTILSMSNSRKNKI